jgi:hypothetical protein
MPMTTSSNLTAQPLPTTPVVGRILSRARATIPHSKSDYCTLSQACSTVTSRRITHDSENNQQSQITPPQPTANIPLSRAYRPNPEPPEKPPRRLSLEKISGPSAPLQRRKHYLINQPASFFIALFFSLTISCSGGEVIFVSCYPNKDLAIPLFYQFFLLHAASRTAHPICMRKCAQETFTGIYPASKTYFAWTTPHFTHSRSADCRRYRREKGISHCASFLYAKRRRVVYYVIYLLTFPNIDMT